MILQLIHHTNIVKSIVSLDQGFPDWVACNPRGTFPNWWGTIKVSSRTEKIYRLYYLFPNIYAYIS